MKEVIDLIKIQQEMIDKLMEGLRITNSTLSGLIQRVTKLEQEDTP